MNRVSWQRLSTWCAVSLLLVATTTTPAWALRTRADWDRTTKVGPDAEVPGWYINLGITGARAMITEAEPKVLLVTFVFKGTPASGKLQKDDKIIGANGRPFVTAHKFGYGAFNVVTAQAMMTWALVERCGLSVDADRFQAAHRFIAKGTNQIGYVWYTDGVGGAGYADMGRTGASALAHYLSPLANEDYKEFAKLNARCIGDHPKTFPDTHGCPLLGMVWTALGAAVDPPSFRKLMDHNRWALSLSHCPDGTFYYQPNRDNNPQDYTAAPRLSATAATALILTVKYKKLQMTGAKPITRK